ncbi:MAG: hypothetical protein U5L98_11350 [Halomonas sp.]|nr:hypothetical protein [Halomonas sp.]MDZ7853210.1 hypothetical protein [Halomonas sp.]
MSVHQSAIHWQHNPHETDANTYYGNHCVTLNGGQQMDTSASVDPG